MMKNRILSLLLAVCLLAGLIPVLPRAAAEDSATTLTPYSSLEEIMSAEEDKSTSKWWTIDTPFLLQKHTYLLNQALNGGNYVQRIRMVDDIDFTVGKITHWKKTSEQIEQLILDVLSIGLFELVFPYEHKVPEWDPINEDGLDAKQELPRLFNDAYNAAFVVCGHRILDLNGHDLIIRYPNVEAGYASLFYLTEGSDLTVIDSAGKNSRIYFDGYIFAAEDETLYQAEYYGGKDMQRDIFTLEKGATLTLDGVTVETGRSKLEYGFNIFTTLRKNDTSGGMSARYTGSATKYVNGSAIVNNGGTVNLNGTTLIGRGYENISNNAFVNHTKNGVIESNGGMLNINDAVIRAKGGADCMQLYNTETHITAAYFSLHRNDTLFCGWEPGSYTLYCVDDEQPFGYLNIPTNAADWANVRVDYASGKGHGVVMGDNPKWRTDMKAAEGDDAVSDFEPWVMISPQKTEPGVINVVSHPESEGQTVVALNPEIKGQLAFRVPNASPFADSPVYAGTRKAWEFRYALKDAKGKTLWTQSRENSSDSGSDLDPAFICLDWYDKALKQIKIGNTYYLTCEYNELYEGATTFVSAGTAAVQFTATDTTVPELNAQISSTSGSFTVAKKGDSITLTASAVGATQSWWERTSAREGGGKEEGTFTPDGATNTAIATLTVPVSAVSQYTCVFANDQGEARTNPVTVSFGMSFTDEGTVVERTAYTGNASVYLYTGNDASDQVTAYKWYRYDDPNSTQRDLITSTDHTKPLSAMTLLIKNPTLEDAGYYRCYLTTANGSYESPLIHLTVVEGNSPNAITTAALTGFDTSELCQGMTPPTDVSTNDNRITLTSVNWSTGVNPSTNVFYGGDASVDITVSVKDSYYFKYDANGEFRWTYNGKTYTAYGSANATAKSMVLKMEFRSYYNQGIKSFNDNIELDQTSFYYSPGQTVDLLLPITVTCPSVHTTEHTLREVRLNTSSTLPNGLSMDSTGHITGTLNVTDGVYRFTVNPITTYGYQNWFYIYFIVGEVSDAELQAAGIPLEEHTWGSWVNNGNGTHSATCSDCGKQKTESHRWGDAVTLVEPTEEGGGTMQYTCLDCGATRTESVGTEGDRIRDTFYTDVKTTAYYINPVLWAMDHDVTNGTSATTFNPNGTCTRAQVVTFLWRASGRPEPTVTTHPFTDVKKNSYYYKAMLWAVENGITNGVSATKFDPNGSCTRAQVVTFLWRANGSPEPTVTTQPFTDVKKSGYYFKAMLWAVENGITKGAAADRFNPNAICTRGQVVTFLHRDFVEQ